MSKSKESTKLITRQSANKFIGLLDARTHVIVVDAGLIVPFLKVRGTRNVR